MQDGAAVLAGTSAGRARFVDGESARIAFGAGSELQLGVAAVGRRGALERTPAEAVQVDAMRIQLDRAPGVVEWWRSLPSGLEQGVTLEQRPSGSGALLIEMSVAGGLTPRSISEDEVVFDDARGRSVARYAHLYVEDSAGREVPARLTVQNDAIVIEVDDATARYPLVVDPFLWAEEATLTAADAQAYDYFGSSVALSLDASVAVIGVDHDDSAGADAGSARIFQRSGSTWTESATLLATDRAQNDLFGASVAISWDGRYVAVGAPSDDTVAAANIGSVRVFVGGGSTYNYQATLEHPSGATGDEFGNAVALSSDASRAIVGARFDDTTTNGAGTAHVFSRSGATWTHEATLSHTSTVDYDNFGNSVAITADGSRVAVGIPGANPGGSVHVFSRNGTVWTREDVLVDPNAGLNDSLGHGVAIASDGSRVVAGAMNDETPAAKQTGSICVFVRTGTTWALEQKLTSPDAGAHMGYSVATSSDGSRVLVGADFYEMGTGSARMYLRDGTTWSDAGRYVPADASQGEYIGRAVALSPDGSRGLVAVSPDTIPAGEYAGSVRVLALPTLANGDPCSVAEDCVSGFCVEGVCCDSACGDGALDDCQACTLAAGALADGTCSPLATGTECRASAGECDVAEACDGTQLTCPTDAFASAGTACSDDADPCTSDECDGSGVCAHAGTCAGGAGGSGATGGSAGSGATGTGGAGASAGGGAGGSAASSKDDGGCGCRTAGTPGSSSPSWLLLAALALLRRRTSAERARTASKR